QLAGEARVESHVVSRCDGQRQYALADVLKINLCLGVGHRPWCVVAIILRRQSGLACPRLIRNSGRDLSFILFLITLPLASFLLLFGLFFLLFGLLAGS